MQRVAVITYRRFRTTYRFPSQDSRIQKKACSPNTEFIYGRVWVVKSLSSMVSANRVDASGWDGGECGNQRSLERDAP